jgi:hypothetical protein
MTLKQESLGTRSMYIFVLAVALSGGILSTQQFVLASSGQTEDRGILGNFADGRRDGLADGASDYRDGYGEFARCPGGSLDYCTGYDVG